MSLDTTGILVVATPTFFVGASKKASEKSKSFLPVLFSVPKTGTRKKKKSCDTGAPLSLFSLSLRECSLGRAALGESVAQGGRHGSCPVLCREISAHRPLLFFFSCALPGNPSECHSAVRHHLSSFTVPNRPPGPPRHGARVASSPAPESSHFSHFGALFFVSCGKSTH